MFKFNRQTKTLDREGKTKHKIEKALLKAKNRNPTFFDEEKDSFFVIDAMSRIITKIEDKDNDLVNIDNNIVADACEAMSLIAKHGYIDLLHHLYYFLDDPDEYIRGKTISTLGDFRIELLSPELRGKLLKMWSDESEEVVVRIVALRVWGQFYTNTFDRNIIKRMYFLFRTQKLDIALRFRALVIIFDVVGERPFYFADLTLYNKFSKLETIDDQGEDSYSEDEFDALVDWNSIHTIIKKYAPEVLYNDKKIET